MAPPGKRRPGFSRRAQYGLFIGYVVAGIGVLIAAVLLIVDAVNPTGFASLRSTVSEVTAPVSGALAALGNGIAAVPGAVGDHFTVMRENARLRAELVAEHRLVMQTHANAYDNRRLLALLHVRERMSGVVAAARLVSSSASSTRRYALLNAGRRQGVREGQPVRGPEGLVGRVLEAGPDTARVLLLQDAESVVPVRRLRDGVPAIASGRGDGLLSIRAISLSDPAFRTGDVLVTSGTGGIYPPDTPVARVVGFNRDGALARPFERPDTLDVAIVNQMFFPAPPPAEVAQ